MENLESQNNTLSEEEQKIINKYHLTNSEWLRYRLTGELPQREVDLKSVSNEGHENLGNENLEREGFLTKADEATKKALGEAYVNRVYTDDEIGGYWFFPPGHYFKSGFIDKSLISKLQEGGTLLSVGGGDGNLETVLWKGFDIPETQISIADYRLHPKVKNLPFKQYEFDMAGTWPNLPNKFDFILFPESFGVAFLHSNFIERFKNVLESVAEKVKKDEEIPDGQLDLFMVAMDQDNPHAKNQLFTIEQALLNLSDDGEIRFSGDFINWQVETYIRLNLKKSYPSAKIYRDEQGILFITKS